MDFNVKYLKLMTCLTLLIVFIILPCTGYPQAKDKIRIGNAISLSGPNVAGAVMTQANPYDMWIKEVNAKGGIFVKENNKKLPIELIRYEDKSDIGTVVKMVEKLILDDKVDLLLPPWSTAMNFAIAPIITKYQYPVMGVTVDSMKIKEMAHTLPYFFIHLNQPPVKAADVDAFLAFTYPPETFLITGQAKAIGFNPKLFYMSIGTAFAAFKETYGANTIEGIMGTGAWNPKVPYSGAKEFWERMDFGIPGTG